MQYRFYKGSNISVIGFGCYAAGGAYGSIDLATLKDVIVRAYELGITFFDVADAYGEAERLLGEALQPFRENVQIATKVGVKEGIKANLGRNYIRKACEQSLRALRTDTIDLYQIHFDDPETAVAETVSVLDELKAEGKIRHYGLGHLPPQRVKEYLTLGEPFSVLMELSAVAPGARDTLLPLCRKHNVGAIAFSVTGRGLLTGLIDERTVFEPDDIRRIDPLFQRERLRAGLQLVQELTLLAAQHGITPVQLAIAWVLRQPGVLSALTGPTSIAHLEENVVAGALKLPEEIFEAAEIMIVRTAHRLRRKQAESVVKILTSTLPADPEAAYVDLIYVIETAVDLGLIAEAEIMPVFQELFVLRQNLDESAPALQRFQKHLKQVVELP